ncbi:MAG: hypothetical protein WAU75_18960 [Solirubrobacteraceae bacterium]
MSVDTMIAEADRRSAARGLARAAVLPAAAVAVHQLRYWLAFGSGAGAELQRQGHSYLHSVAPWIVVALAWGIGAFLSALGRAFNGHTSMARYGFSLVALWVICAASLVAIYSGQEFLEGLLATGHPAGLAGIFGYGGWWAIPAAVCVGLVLAALLHGARWVLHEVAARRMAPARAPSPPGVVPGRPAGISLPRPAPLALGWCGRGPPV